MKKRTALGAGAAALLTAVFFTIFGTNTGTDLTGTYKIERVSDYQAVITLSVPEAFGADIFTLKMGDMEIEKGILPGKMAVHPIVTSDLSRLSVIFERRGEQIGVGTFSDDGLLLIRAKEGVLHED